MITQDEAGALAGYVVRNYIGTCGCANSQDFANAMIVLLGVAAGGIGQAVGVERCSTILMELAEDIKNQPQKGETVQ